jgi:hypothetical protein
MKIWYLPPKYIDTKRLVVEHSQLTIFLEYLSSNHEWAGYYYLRLQMIQAELSARKVRYSKIDLNPYDYILKRTPDHDELDIAKRNLLTEWGSEMFTDETVIKLDLLSAMNADELYVESEFLIEQYRREYEL